MKKISFLAIALCICMAAFSEKAADPTQASHFIAGHCDKQLDKDGQAVYKLTNVKSVGFEFEKEKNGEWIGKYNAERGDVEFRFQKATTTHPDGIKNSTLDFWTYDAEINEWQHDIEVRQGTSETSMTKQMVIMLVLDYSQSVGTDGVATIKQSAKSFIDNIYSASKDGNIKIGIIKFNTKAYAEEHTFPIQPLNPNTYPSMMYFIENQEIDKGTALYYSIDKAVGMMKESAKNIPVDKYAGAYMLIFTDGLDNVSTNDSKGLLTPDNYYNHVKNLLVNEKIHGQRIESHLVALRGNDITTDAQYQKFTNKMSALCEQYHQIAKFAELKTLFNDFAESLVNRWISLRCFIPEGRIGDVCWTLGKVEIPVEKINKKKTNNPDELANAKKKLFLGVDFGGGLGLQDDLYGHWALGASFSYPITRKFGLGAYLSGGTSENSRDGGMYLTSGLQMTIGDYAQKRACIIGIGGGIDYGASMADFRVGGVWANGFYFFGDLGLGSAYNGYRNEYYVQNYGYDYYSGEYVENGGYYQTRTDYYNVFAFNIGIHIGYNFGRFIKCK